MIVVLDTNVIVSAILSRKGNPAEIIRRWEAEEFDVATSQVLIQELEKALNYNQVRKYTQTSDEEIQNLLARLHTAAIVVDPQIQLNVIAKDPDDNRVLECALSARAHYIISGNKHLLDLKEHEGVIIMSPASFLTLLKAEKDQR
jgi:uncharacterized protein